MPPYENLWTVVVAGGSGRRFGAPKQFSLLTEDVRVLDRSLQVAQAVSAGVVVVLPAADLGEVRAQPEGRHPLRVVAGGASRAESVRAGLAAVPASAEVICVHDGARPFADADLYHRVVEALEDPRISAVVPGLAVTDTIKRVRREGVVAVVVETPARESLVAVQTPQAFRAEVLRAAHEQAATADPASSAGLTDDAMMVEALGHVVAVVEGSPINRKITLVEDLAWARDLAGREENR